MMIDLHDRYPGAKLELDGLSLRIRGAQGPGNDPVLERQITIEVSDEAFWRHHSWWIPAAPEYVSLAEKRLKAKIPDDVAKRARFISRVNEARAKANIWREMPAEFQRAWLDKIGVRFKVEPLNHQVTSIGWCLQNPLAAIFLDTGLGKTYIGAHIIQTLKEKMGSGPALVVAPKSVLRVGWGEDIEKFTDLKWCDIGDPPAPAPITVCPKCKKSFGDKVVPKVHLKTHLKQKLQGLKKEQVESFWEKFYEQAPGLRPAGNIDYVERVNKALADKTIDVFLINPAKVKSAGEILKQHQFRMLIVDESSMMKAFESDQTKAIIDLALGIPRRIMMSGTPRPNSSLELWGQFAALDGCLGHDYRTFRAKYFQVDFSGYRWNPRPGMDHKFAEMLEERSLRFRRKECLDLPPETTETREVELTDELRGHYKSMLEEMIVELEDNQVATPHKLVQINKLSQITSGFIYDADKNLIPLGSRNPKFDETVKLTKSLIEEEDRSVVIWIRWSKVEVDMLRASLKSYGISTCVGGMKSEDIQKSVEDFKSNKNRIMIAHPLSAKFGHTWVNATAAIFHSYDYSWENYYQAKARIYRLGQKNPVTYFNIVARKTIDKIIMKALQRKEDESAVVVDRKFVRELKATLL